MHINSLLIADDHQVVIEGIKGLFTARTDISIVGEAGTGEQAVALAEALKPDVIIMDISMPGMNGVEATIAIRQTSPTSDIIIYTMHSDQRFILELFKAGISGHVLKADDPAHLVKAVDAVIRGGTYFTTVTPHALLAQFERAAPSGREQPLEHLSQRELEVFRLLADGAAVKQIAAKLCISPKTVETHKYNVMEKLEARTLAELTKIALRHGLIKP